MLNAYKRYKEWWEETSYLREDGVTFEKHINEMPLYTLMEKLLDLEEDTYETDTH